MVIDAHELGVGGVLVAIGATVAGLLCAALLIGMLFARVGSDRFRIWSMASGLVIALALLVDVVVVSRALAGEVTGWDLVWAAGLTAAAVWAVRRSLTM
jgi:hypothetical protein